MFIFEIAGLLFKVSYRLLIEFPANFRFLEKRMLFHNSNQAIDEHVFNKKKLKLYCRVATIGLACLEHLNNKKATDGQRKSMFIGCAIAPIIDELMDEKGYSANDIQLVLQKKHKHGTIEERVAIGFLNDLDEHAPNIGQSEIWQRAIAFQVKSNQQFDKALSQDELIELSFEKGGNGLLLAMLATFPDLIETSIGRRAFYNVGAIIQFVDDVFDVWFDREEGQQTLATNCPDINGLSTLFENTILETHQLLYKMPLKKSRINAFVFELKCYTSLGKIALDRLLLLQKNSNGIFQANSYSRKELVTDMSLWPNRIKYLWLVLFK